MYIKCYNTKKIQKIFKNPKKVHFLTQLLFHVLYVVLLYACMFFWVPYPRISDCHTYVYKPYNST